MAAPNESQIWLVTGCSTGFGRHIVEQALKRGQKVIATSRNVSRLKELRSRGADTMELDPNAAPEKLNDFAHEVLQRYGHVDVIVNNAGYMQHGTIEETSSNLLEQQFKTNVFAPINLTKAFLPSMRKRRSGTIVMIGSVVAYVFYPTAGIYDSSKAALRGLTHALAAEVKDLGIRVTHIEPGLFRTAVFNDLDPDERPENAIDDYDKIRRDTIGYFASTNGKQAGDPSKLGSLIVDLVLGEGLAAGRGFPSALTMGNGAVRNMERVLQEDMRRITEWKDVSCSTDFDK